MPPERTPTGTASRFSQALETGAPLSSVGAAHPPSLERGKACLTCRRRRVKCDGARPVCARCAKSARAHGEDPSSFVCVYNSSVPKPKSGSAVPAADGGGDAEVIANLAAQVAALEEQLVRSQQQQSQLTPSSAGHTPPGPGHQAFEQQAFASTSSLTLDADPAAYFAGASLSDASGSGATPAAYTSAPQLSAYYGASDGAGGTASTSLVWTPSLAYASSGPDLTDLATAASPLYQLQLPTLNWGALTHSAYPPDLPSPQLFARLVDAFFAKPHLATGLVNERRFRASLAYLDGGASGPGGGPDPRAPAPCLLHAVVATAALLVPESFYASSEPRYWPSGSTLSSHHAQTAERALDGAFQRGHQLLQVVQASVLCCFCAYTDARFGDIWLVSSMTARLAITVGLNHVRPGAPPADGQGVGVGVGGVGGGVGGAPARTENAHRRQRRIKEKSMLAPTSDREELDERASVFFFAFAADKMTSAATGWAAAIDEDDVTTLLPHPPGAEDTSDDPLSSPLYLHNPSFFFANPPHLTEAPQLFFKAYVLLGRVVRFLQRASEPIGSGWPREGEPDLRDTPGFRTLERTISHFRQSIPRELSHAYYASHAGIGIATTTPLLVQTILHVLTILMHEPFCLAVVDAGAAEGDEGESFRRCKEAAKAIVASVYELSGSSFEIGLLASFLNYLWAVAGRTLVRALALASRRGDLAAAAQLANDVKALIGAMQANRSRVGAVTAQNLQRLVLHPFQVLAESYAGPGYGAVPRSRPRSGSGSGPGSASGSGSASRTGGEDASAGADAALGLGSGLGLGGTVPAAGSAPPSTSAGWEGLDTTLDALGVGMGLSLLDGDGGVWGL